MNRDKAREKIKRAKHQSKPTSADVVLRDSEGNWLLEVYGDVRATGLSDGLTHDKGCDTS